MCRSISRYIGRVQTALCTCAFLVIILTWRTLRFGTSSYKVEEIAIPPRNEVVILAWTKFFKNPMSSSYYLWACPSFKCEISNDRAKLNAADVVLFHRDDLQWNDLPTRRSEKQIFVFWSQESPGTSLKTNSREFLNFVPNYFNWTMTMRRDSDVWIPQKQVLREEAVDADFILDWSNRTSSIAWLVSNCRTDSKREVLVEKLKRFIDVDVLGKCGRTDFCPSDFGSSYELCMEKISKTFNFYLSFENSVCDDYVTEKFWTPLSYGIVPIVLKRSVVEGIAPPNSFIAVDDFASLKDLAERLKFLTLNTTAYSEYFDWRRKGYRIGSGVPGHYLDFCRICELFSQPNYTPVEKSYSDLTEWWVAGSHCVSNVGATFN